MSAVRQASPLRFLSSYLLCLMSLSPSTCAFNETMVLSSNERWVCQVLKGEEDKWREGTRGCEDNGFLWWLTFPSGASKKVWLSHCVFTDSKMSGGFGTSSVCGTEGNKHTMSNLHLGGGVPPRVGASPRASVCKPRVTHSPFSFFWTGVYTVQPAWRWVSSHPLGQWVSRLAD